MYVVILRMRLLGRHVKVSRHGVWRGARDEKIETPRNFQATLSLDISEMPERLAE